MAAIMTLDQGREISPQELRRQIEPISLRDGLRFVTQMSARQFVYATDESLRLANSQNLAILAKAFVLWGNAAARPLNRNSDGQDEEGYWLLAGVNSLPWHSRLAAEFDTDASVISMLIRQAFFRVAADDPLDGLIARTWMMFHEIIAEGGFDVADPSAELEKEFDVSARTSGRSAWLSSAFTPRSQLSLPIRGCSTRATSWPRAHGEMKSTLSW